MLHMGLFLKATLRLQLVQNMGVHLFSRASHFALYKGPFTHHNVLMATRFYAFQTHLGPVLIMVLASPAHSNISISWNYPRDLLCAALCRLCIILATKQLGTPRGHFRAWKQHWLRGASEAHSPLVPQLGLGSVLCASGHLDSFHIWYKIFVAAIRAWWHVNWPLFPMWIITLLACLFVRLI